MAWPGGYVYESNEPQFDKPAVTMGLLFVALIRPEG